MKKLIASSEMKFPKSVFLPTIWFQFADSMLFSRVR